MESAQRKSNKKTTNEQFALLVRELAKHPEMAKCAYVVGAKRIKYDAIWSNISMKLNSIGPPIRNEPQWKKVWSDLKGRKKKKIVMAKMQTTEEAISHAMLKSKVDDSIDHMLQVLGNGASIDHSLEHGSADDEYADDEDADNSMHSPSALSPARSIKAEPFCMSEPCSLEAPDPLTLPDIPKQTAPAVHLVSTQASTSTPKPPTTLFENRFKPPTKRSVAKNETFQMLRQSIAAQTTQTRESANVTKSILLMIEKQTTALERQSTATERLAAAAERQATATERQVAATERQTAATERQVAATEAVLEHLRQRIREKSPELVQRKTNKRYK